MLLKGFLFVSLITAIVLLLLCVFSSSDKLSSVTRKPWLYYGILALMLLLSFFTLNTYFNPDHDRFYKNTDSDVVELDGMRFSIDKTLKLCSANENESLFSSSLGELSLASPNGEGLVLNTNDFDQPLYISDEKNANLFHVVNCPKELVLKEGDTLLVEYDETHDTLFYLRYEMIKEKGKHFWNKKQQQPYYRFVFKTKKTPMDTVVKGEFKKGYGVCSMIQEGFASQVDDGTNALFGNCYLLREHYAIDGGKDENPDESIRFFCSNALRNSFDSISFYINGAQQESLTTIKSHPVERRNFFYGLGISQSDIFSAKTVDSKIHLDYRLPVRYSFPHDSVTDCQSELFICTNTKDIIERDDDFKYFYRFVGLLSEENVYNAAGFLTYVVGKANQSLDARFSDLNHNKPSIDSIGINEEFELGSRSFYDGSSDSNHTADLSYVFRVVDFRSDNVVSHKALPLYLTILVLLLVVFWMISCVEESCKNIKRKPSMLMVKWYLIETMVYLVLIAFLTVRLVMLWRLQAFPPIDDTSYFEFQQFRGHDSFNWTMYSIWILLVLRIGLLVFQVAQNKTKKTKSCFNHIVDWIVQPSHYSLGVRLLILAVVYGIFLLFFYMGQHYLTFFKTTIPPFLFFAINSVLYVGWWEQDNKKRRQSGLWWLILVNCALFFLLLVIFEAGMVVPMIGFVGVLLLLMLWPLFREIGCKDSYAKIWKVFLVIASLSMLTLSFVHLPFAKQLSPIYGVFSHRMQARNDALVYNPTELFQRDRVQFNDTYSRDIANASSNYWFIDSHLDYYKKTVSPNKPSFALSKDYTQQGVKYLIQTRDLSLLRYLVFEHGYRPAIYLLLLLLLLFSAVIANTRLWKGNGTDRTNQKYPNYLNWLSVQMSLFILIFSLYLFLVNLKMVVFVGLDFPFLTLTSRAVPISFAIMLFAILMPYNGNHIEECFVDRNYSEEEGRNRKIDIAVSALIVLCGILPPMVKHNNSIKSEASYNVSLEPLANFVNNVFNPKFKMYQKDPANADFMKMKMKDPNMSVRLKSYVDEHIAIDLKDYAKEYEKGERDTAFIHSAFNKYFSTSLQDLNYILHLRKKGSYYVFVTNKDFYHIKPIFDNDEEREWHGDLLAANTISRVVLVGTASKNDVLQVPQGRFNDFQSNEKFLNRYLPSQFNVYNIPAKYTAEGHDVVIVNPDGGKYDNFYLYPSGKVGRGFEMQLSCQMKPNDVIQWNKNKLSLESENNHYLARRIHYNGKHQVIYPLGENFMFAYNFDNMLVNNYTEFDNPNEPVRISLDYDLLNEIDDYYQTTIRGVLGKFSQGVSVVAVDGNGRIRLLADCNAYKRADLRIDPNDASRIRKKMEEIYLNDDGTTERMLLINSNLRYLEDGPGSTIKPVLYTAIASQTNISWSKFRLHAAKKYFKNLDIYKKRKNVAAALKFGDENIAENENYRWIEDQFEAPQDIDMNMGVPDFIKTSNNFFFGSILMLGSYPGQKLADRSALTQMPSNDCSSFPIFGINGEYYKLHNGFVNECFCKPEVIRESALETGLLDNFKYKTVEQNLLSEEFFWKNSYSMQTVHFLGIDKFKSTHASYVFSEKPHLYRPNVENGDRLSVLDAHFNIVKGGNPIYTSPLNMAEAYLRIAQLNADNNLLTFDDASAAANMTPMHTKGYDDGAFEDMMRNNIYLGMWKVMGEAGGTMKDDTDYQSKLRAGENAVKKPIYIYGKTGTCGANHDLGTRNLFYGFILANQPLHGETPIDREHLKIYVIYMGFYDTSIGGHHQTAKHPKKVLGTMDYRHAIIDRIIESETFKNYWNE